MEATTAVDAEANLFVEVNGLGVSHSAVRFINQNTWALNEASLGYTLEASDVVEFKYIRD